MIWLFILRNIFFEKCASGNYLIFSNVTFILIVRRAFKAMGRNVKMESFFDTPARENNKKLNRQINLSPSNTRHHSGLFYWSVMEKQVNSSSNQNLPFEILNQMMIPKQLAKKADVKLMNKADHYNFKSIDKNNFKSTSCKSEDVKVRHDTSKSIKDYLITSILTHTSSKRQKIKEFSIEFKRDI